MEKILSQEEVEALLRRGPQGGEAQPAAGGGVKAEQPAERVEPWDLRQAALMRKEQLYSISQLHEGFARNLTSSVSAFLRDKFEVTLVSVEQLAYRDFLARVQETTYYGAFRLLPADLRGVLQMELSLVFPTVDILLGGPGSPSSASREVTDIEELVLRGLCQLICHELHNTWHPLGLVIEYEKHLPASKVVRLMPGPEKTLSLTFEVTMPDSRGMLNLAIPAVVSSAALRKLDSEMVYQGPRGQDIHRENIRQRLQDSVVEVELGTRPAGVRFGELAQMRPGGVLNLGQRAAEPAQLRLQGRDCWLARPVARDGYRAAQLLERIRRRPEEES